MVWKCVTCRCMCRPEQSIGPLGAEVTDDYEPQNMGAGNQMGPLEDQQALDHLFSPCSSHLKDLSFFWKPQSHWGSYVYVAVLVRGSCFFGTGPSSGAINTSWSRTSKAQPVKGGVLRQPPVNEGQRRGTRQVTPVLWQRLRACCCSGALAARPCGHSSYGS